jgi:CBS domain-containing protein
MHATPKRTDELFPYRSVRQILASRPQVVHAVAPDDPASLALQRMAEQDIGLVVVLDGARLAGVLSERDLARHAGRPQARPLRDIKVAELMTRDVATVGPDESFGRCMALMDERRARHLPIVEAGRVIDVISIRDLLREAVAHHRHVLAELERERLATFQSIS